VGVGKMMMMIIIIIIIIGWREKGCGFFVSPDITNIYHCWPWFLINQSIV
jgi:hypothetical protein